MIYKDMRGRLGNQLFQYAMMRYIQEINNNQDKLIMNFNKYVYSKNFKDDLQYFKVKKYYKTEKNYKTIKQRIIILILRIYKRIIRFFDKKNYREKRKKIENKLASKLIEQGIYWKEDGYLECVPTDVERKIVIGHFESAKNFEKIKNKLQEEIVPKYDKREENIELYNIINNTNSVCVTIRRGDYVENEKFKKQFYVCTPEYFYKAIKEIKKYIKNPTFIFFSDDIDWVKKNMNLPKTSYFETGNDPIWEKLRLMYSCKNFIISNSTFSWWAQYLSKNENKIVIAPKKWSNVAEKKEIYDENWILI